MKGFKRKKRAAIMLLAAMSLLSACSSNSSAPSDAHNQGAEQTSNAGANTGKAQQVTLRVMDWSDSTKAIREEFHRKFTEKYPNIKIEYTQLTIDQFKNTILTAVKSEEAPDLFPIPTGMKLSTLVKDGWFQPLDPYIDDSFKSLFVDGTFQEGTTKVDGKIYAIPESLSLPGTLLFYNKKLFQEAGLDPEKPPATYSDFREAAKKITEAGGGKYYGIIEGGKQTNRWTDAARDWSALAGSGLNSQSPVSLVTKKTTYDSEAVLGLFDLFQSIAKDGSYHPKTMSLSAPEARALFAQGQAGFIIQGAWNVGVWKRDNPELDFGVAPPPVPDSKQKGALPLTSSGGWLGLSAKSEHPEEAALYLKEYYGGDFFQAKKVESGDSFSVVKGINEKYATSEQLKQYYDIAIQYGRTVPDPNILNPAVSEVFAAFKDVHPSLGELLAGVVGGAISDAPEKLHKLSEQLDRAWSEAIEAAKKNGAAVDANDFEFANWKPLDNYEADDYASAK